MRKEEEMAPEPTTTTSSADALTSKLTRTVLQQSPSSVWTKSEAGQHRRVLAVLRYLQG